jgi:glutaredoxin
MNLSNEFPVTIFRNEYEGKVYYKMGLSKKKEDGTYENGSIACRFKKDVSIEDKTKIYIKSAWLTFYKKDKETVPYIFVNGYETVGQAIENSKEPNPEKVQSVDDPFKDFGNDMEFTDDDLPF